MKKFVTLSVLVFMLSTLLPSTVLAAYSSSRVISGATAAFDYVYTDGDNTDNVTDEAADNDNDYFHIFTDSNSSDQYLYLGMQTIYDRIYFDVHDAIEFEDSAGLEWEYRSEDDGWETLKLTSDNLDNFEDEGENYVAFSVPDDWDEYSWNSNEAYWVRVKPEDDVDTEAELDQISARAYTVYFEIEDEDGDEVDDLTSSDFDVDDASDETVYALQNLKKGKYALALQTEASDVSYTLIIDDSRFGKEETTVKARTDAVTYKIELNGDADDDDDNDDDDDTHFIDLRNHWARTEVENLYNRGVVAGVSYYYYMPNIPVTRAEFLKMALLNADEDLGDYNDDEPYKDVSSNDWFYDYIVAAYEMDLITKATYFRPNEPINRAEAVALLVRLADVDVSSGSYGAFDDVSSYSWYAKYVYTAWRESVVDGYTDGNFRPNKTLTRGEAAVMVDNAYEAWYD